MSGPYIQPLVYSFGQGRADGTAAMKEVLGGKGAGLAEMTTIGIPVPPGFTISSSLCQHYLEQGHFPKRLQAQVENALQRLEAATGKHLGDRENPLLVSVRSGAAVSMRNSTPSPNAPPTTVEPYSPPSAPWTTAAWGLAPSGPVKVCTTPAAPSLSIR